jgi:hypothetical protein
MVPCPSNPPVLPQPCAAHTLHSLLEPEILPSAHPTGERSASPSSASFWALSRTHQLGPMRFGRQATGCHEGNRLHKQVTTPARRYRLLRVAAGARRAGIIPLTQYGLCEQRWPQRLRQHASPPISSSNQLASAQPQQARRMGLSFRQATPRPLVDDASSLKTRIRAPTTSQPIRRFELRKLYLRRNRFVIAPI